MKKKAHVSFSGPILDGLKALAALEQRDVSDILDDLARAHLAAHGFVQRITPEMIQEQIEANSRSKPPSPKRRTARPSVASGRRAA